MSATLKQLVELLGTTRDTTVNLTGSWRYFRPSFAEMYPPCAASCPAGNPIRDFMRLTAAGDARAALAAIKIENPIPSVCGRVCHHPCVIECTRGDADEALTPYLVERSLGDISSRNGLCIPVALSATGRKVAVVGSGPAGLSCAYQCALLGHDVTIFESASTPGGMLRAGIPAYRLPRAAIDVDLEFIIQLGIKLVLNKNVKSFSELDGFDAACISVGAHSGRPLGIPGGDAPGVIPGLEFLAEVNSGGRPDIGKNVIVIGGGNTATDCARAAMRLGAAAKIVYRRTREDMPALPDEIAEAADEGVSIEFQAAPVKVLISNGRAAAVQFIRTSPGEPDPDGRRSFKPIPGSEFTIEAGTIITAVGELPATTWLPASIVENGGALSVDPTTMQITSAEGGIRDGLFCAGDAAATGQRTVSHAIGAGKRAAVAIDILLGGKFDRAQEIMKSIAVGENGALSMKAYKSGYCGTPIPVVLRSNANVFRVPETPAANPSHKPAGQRLKDFSEVNEGLSGDDVVREAARCLQCGTCTDCGTCLLFCPDISVMHAEGSTRPDFNFDYCKGCGICARECPRAAIVMIEEEK